MSHHLAGITIMLPERRRALSVQLPDAATRIVWKPCFPIQGVTSRKCCGGGSVVPLRPAPLQLGGKLWNCRRLLASVTAGPMTLEPFCAGRWQDRRGAEIGGDGQVDDHCRRMVDGVAGLAGDEQKVRQGEEWRRRVAARVELPKAAEQVMFWRRRGVCAKRKFLITERAGVLMIPLNRTTWSRGRGRRYRHRRQR